ncbi:glycoside hydrolase family 16 protein [Pseudonocardia benzenivorans]|uniref:Glycoside hydrolase family 16 protein n=1 Tax=Pseudonocardia benzenivorans TaxID=228005 RepID=A0ABW3VGU0_9PSEU
MGVGLFAATTAAALSLSATLTPAVDAGSADSCAWRRSAVRLHQELTGEQNTRAVELRTLLGASGVGEPDFLPERRRSGADQQERTDNGASNQAGPSAGRSAGSGPSSGSTSSGASTSSGGSTGVGGAARSGDDSFGSGAAPGPGDSSSSGGSSAGAGTSAARRYGWGTPNRVDEFDSPASADNWSIYDGPGHAGNGRRTPDAVSIADGILTITGDSAGNTAGMAWNPGQKYGRWEGRVKAPASDESYNALLLLWPDAENFPVGGEVDFMEMMDHTRRKTELFLHYGADNSQVHGEVKIDATQWHNWAVEWTPDKITAFVDGAQWWTTTDTSIFPPGPMHLCIQLDWFPKGGDVQESYMHVDWVKQYSLDGSQSPSTDEQASTGSTAADASTTDEINNGGSSGGASRSPADHSGSSGS